MAWDETLVIQVDHPLRESHQRARDGTDEGVVWETEIQAILNPKLPERPTVNRKQS